MLVDSPRLTDADRAAWAALSPRFRRPGWQVEEWGRKAASRIRRFGPARVSVSWGKDSLVVAHLARQVSPDSLLVWVRLPGVDNPDCEAVRDEYLSRWPMPYAEVWADAPRRDEGGHLVTGARSSGYRRASREHGERHISGVRAAESGTRALSAAVHGVATERTCRPILDWPTAHVFAYLLHHDLPIHPAYAMSMGGTLDLEQLRVASIGGVRGGWRREQWERSYYPDILSLGVAGAPPPARG